MRPPKHNTRNNRGSSLLEVPVSLWMVFVVFFMPMISLATITMRAAIFSIAVHDAVSSAAKARTFDQASTEGQSAKQKAADVFQQYLACFAGQRSAEIDLDILSTTVGSGVTTRSEDKLTVPANTSNAIFQIEGSAQGTIEPLIAGNPAIFGNIPGFTTPIVIKIAAREIAENPQGLNR